MNLAAISLSNEGSRIAAKLAASWLSCDVFLHAGVTELPQARRFDRLAELSQEIFPLYQGLVYIAPIGAVVRAIAPCIRHKTVDPAVVAVDVGGRWAVSLLSGHEGGANQLAMAVANILDAEAGDLDDHRSRQGPDRRRGLPPRRRGRRDRGRNS